MHEIATPGEHHQQQLMLINQQQLVLRGSSDPSSSATPTPGVGAVHCTSSRPHTSASSSGCTPTDGTGSIHSGAGGSSTHNSTGGGIAVTDQLQPTMLVCQQTPSPPDLLDQTNNPGAIMVNGGKFKKTSTPMNLNAATLGRNGVHSVGTPSPVPSTISSVMGVSPFCRSGTLPLHHGGHIGTGANFYSHTHQTCGYHHHHPRSVSCDHSSNISQHYGPQHQTLKFHNHQGVHGVVGLPQPQTTIQTATQRPGYVTLPRRPKNSSWSAGSGVVPQPTISPYLPTHQQIYSTLTRASSITPTPSQVGTASLCEREPIYDGVGPRTSADGSSKLSLSSTMPRQHNKKQGTIIQWSCKAQLVNPLENKVNN